MDTNFVGKFDLHFDRILSLRDDFIRTLSAKTPKHLPSVTTTNLNDDGGGGGGGTTLLIGTQSTRTGLH